MGHFLWLIYLTNTEDCKIPICFVVKRDVGNKQKVSSLGQMVGIQGDTGHRAIMVSYIADMLTNDPGNPSEPGKPGRPRSPCHKKET